MILWVLLKKQLKICRRSVEREALGGHFGSFCCFLLYRGDIKSGSYSCIRYGASSLPRDEAAATRAAGSSAKAIFCFLLKLILGNTRYMIVKNSYDVPSSDVRSTSC